MKKLLMLAKKDREDGWFYEHSAICFEVPKDVVTFEDAFNHTKESIEKCVEWIIEEACLENDLFDGEPYEFKGVEYSNYGVGFNFELASGYKILYFVKMSLINFYSKD